MLSARDGDVLFKASQFLGLTGGLVLAVTAATPAFALDNIRPVGPALDNIRPVRPSLDNIRPVKPGLDNIRPVGPSLDNIRPVLPA